MATNWREAIEELAMPPWARRFFGERLIGTFALVYDIVSEAVSEAAFAPWLLEPTSPDDILPYIGLERGMEQYPGESNDSYRERLHGAWDAWLQAGNEAAIIAQLEGLGFTDIELKSYRDVGWDWDSAADLTWEEGVGGEDNWSRFWVVIKGHPFVGEGTFGDGAILGDGGVNGLNATLEMIGAMKRLIHKWKPAHVQCAEIIIVMDEVTWDLEQPDGTWYDWRNRSESARYIPVDQRPILLP